MANLLTVVELTQAVQLSLELVHVEHLYEQPSQIFGVELFGIN